MSIRTLWILFAILIASIASQAMGVVNGYFEASREGFASVQFLALGCMLLIRYQARKDARECSHSV